MSAVGRQAEWTRVNSLHRVNGVNDFKDGQLGCGLAQLYASTQSAL